MRLVIYIIFTFVLLAVLYAASLYNYLLFHSLAEGFSVAIACGVFMVSWNSRRFAKYQYLLLIGVAYLFVGMIDFVHALTYEGMNIITGFGPNAPTQLWIAARYIESITLLAAPMMLHARIKPYYYLLLYSAISVLLMLSILVWRNFPDCFLPGVGLTSFKIVSEYIICVLLITSGALFLHRRKHFEKGFLTWTLFSIAATILSELAFANYASVDGFPNLVGHILKIVSYYLIYKAVIETGLAKPYFLLFRDLHRQRERFQVILNSIVDAVIATDADGCVTFINPVAEALTGWKSDEALNQPVSKVFRVIDEKTVQPIKDPVETVLPGGALLPLAGDILILTKEGVTIPIEGSAAPLSNIEGQVNGVVLVFRDITELKAAETRNRHLASFPQLNPNPILEVAADGTIVFSNQATRKFLEELGLPGDDASVFLPQDIDLLLRGLDDKQDQSIYREVAVKDKIFSEAIYLTPQFSVARIYTHDITAIKQADLDQIRIRERQALLATVAERLLRSENPESIIDELCRLVMAHLDCQFFFNYLVEETGRILHLNACAGITPETADKMRHLDFEMAVSGRVVLENQGIIAENIQDSGDTQTQLVKSLGMEAYCCHPLMGPDRIIGTLAFGTKTRPGFTNDEVALMKSVSDHVAVAMQHMLAARELQKLNETLEQKVTTRTELAESRSRQLQALAVELTEAEERERQRIAQLLHDDLQQILAAARMQIEVACDRLPEDKTLVTVEKLLLESIEKSRRLSHELSPPVLHHFGLTDAISWLLLQMKAQFGLQVEFSEDSFPVVENNFLKVFVFRAVQELLFNVVKHSGKKKAHLKLSGSGNGLNLVVSDQGRGFDTGLLDITTSSGGFGLLSLSERARYIGGSLAVESAPGKGSRFTLMVPSALAVSVQTARPTAEGLQAGSYAYGASTAGPKGVRVLFVDDHKVMRQGLVELVRGQPNIQVVGEAANGLDAIEQVRQLHPNVVVMDINMPEMDGVEATRQIIAECPDVQVIGLSMLEDEQVVERMRTAGATAFVSKTASTAELLKAIYGVMQQ